LKGNYNIGLCGEQEGTQERGVNSVFRFSNEFVKARIEYLWLIDNNVNKF